MLLTCARMCTSIDTRTQKNWIYHLTDKVTAFSVCFFFMQKYQWNKGVAEDLEMQLSTRDLAVYL